jgi:hypothetical protein
MIEPHSAAPDDIAGLRAELQEAYRIDARASWMHPFDAQQAAMSASLAERAEAVIATLSARIEALQAENARSSENYANAWSALGMIREAIEAFGPVSTVDSPEGVLLRGPEPVHEAEALVEGILRIKAALADALETAATALDEANGKEVGDLTGADEHRRAAALLSSEADHG